MNKSPNIDLAIRIPKEDEEFYLELFQRLGATTIPVSELTPGKDWHKKVLKKRIKSQTKKKGKKSKKTLAFKTILLRAKSV